MSIESVHIGMPVYHKDGVAHMTVSQVLPTGYIVCVWTEPDGREVEQTFRPMDLELGAHENEKFSCIGL